MSEFKFVGTGGGFATTTGTTAGYVMVDDKMVLFDCGETTRMNMHMQDILAKEKPKSMDIIITHCHSDHIGSLGNSVLRNNIFLPEPTTIIFPNKKKMEVLMDYIMEMPQIIYNDDKTKEKRMYSIKTPEEIMEYSLQTYPVVHGLWNLDFKVMPMEAYSYLFSDSNQNFYYGGDGETVPTEIMQKFLNGQIGHMYLESQKENYAGHMPIGYLEEQIPEEKRPNVTLMHLSDTFDIGYAKTKGFRTARD